MVGRDEGFVLAVGDEAGAVSGGFGDRRDGEAAGGGVGPGETVGTGAEKGGDDRVPRGHIIEKKFSWTKRTGLLGELAFWARTRGSHHVASSGEEKTRSDPAVAVLTTKVPWPEATPLRGPRVRPVSARANLNGGMRALGPDTTARRRRRRRRSRTGACRRETRTEPQATS